jgi:uncharacterized membrane protein
MFLCLAVAGCQQNTTSSVVQDENAITGKIYLGEDLVNYGVVSFISETKTMKSPVYPDGTYKIRNAPPGEYRVVVVLGPIPIMAGGGSSNKPPPTFKKMTLPTKYTNSETTDLKYQVKEGRHDFDIKMESEPKK